MGGIPQPHVTWEAALGPSLPYTCPGSAHFLSGRPSNLGQQHLQTCEKFKAWTLVILVTGVVLLSLRVDEDVQELGSCCPG